MQGLVVFGRTGQVARELAALAPDATFVGRDRADLTDPAARKVATAKLAHLETKRGIAEEARRKFLKS